MSKVLSVRLPDELAQWADDYAAQRGVSRAELLEQAIVSFKVDCDTGVPEFRERLRRQRAAQLPGSGECSCPELPGDHRGFSQRCAVHGGKSREDFANLTANRSAVFRQLETPASIKYGKASKPKDAA